MGRANKATLWIAGAAIIGYFAWFYTSCALDPACHVMWCGRHPCGVSTHPVRDQDRFDPGHERSPLTYSLKP